VLRSETPGGRRGCQELDESDDGFDSSGYATADDPLISAVDDLFTVRSGGSAIASADAIAHLERAGVYEHLRVRARV
jgi:hypothetical protein